MSIRALHHTKAVKQIEAAGSIVELAELEKQELEGGEHRKTVADEFKSRAAVLVAAGVPDDVQLEVMAILDGKTGSIILAALEGDSHSDDDTGPGEIREGGGSPSEAAGHLASAVESFTRGAALLRGGPAKPRGRIVGSLVRARQPDGTVKVLGMAELRRRRT